MARKLRGITITLCERTQTGVDAFNRPVYQWTEESVDNVLVSPAGSTEILDTLNITGKKIVYKLAIPKGDDHVWENRKVILPAPFEGEYITIGIPTAGIESMIPLGWNKQIQVAKYGE